jgi:hypothetical protein
VERVGEGWEVRLSVGPTTDAVAQPPEPATIHADITTEGLSLAEAEALAQALLAAVEDARS